MNQLQIIWAYFRYRPLMVSLNLLLMTIGMMLITALFMISEQLEQRLSRNAEGIDLVIGAKGSPLQLILASIYHSDMPTGNIPLSEVKPLLKSPLIETAIPLALGDSYHGFRIVGTSLNYPTHYHAQLSAGHWWDEPLQVVLGATVARQLNLSLGQHFVGSHGLGETGDVHDAHPYVVVGILAKTGLIIDELILTSVVSVWQVHSEHGTEAHHADAQPNHEHDHEPHSAIHSESINTHLGVDLGIDLSSIDEKMELTAVLVRYRSALAAVTLPRLVNRQSTLQAAVPAFEISRLLKIMGFGMEGLKGFGILLMLISALSILISLYYALQERYQDLALMRLLGASRNVLLSQLLLEGMIIALIGAVLGIIFGHGLVISLAYWFSISDSVMMLNITLLLGLLLFALLLGLLAAIIPAWRAYHTEVATALQ
ncbi:ABC transporter permease [Thioflexithrix psekupsensis]|uniref:ABC transporter permease n=1 Tax=Thioflexithrix psekupsensis TaxID=1570016 RepID=A0A251X7Y7_9GAMM|nr:ABC transporter permease [Thioflexithrix psekupsensis]OUD13904.1 hypothetical protein TPSD3_06055 [Thioflexithrix psekupsensis]